MKTVASLVVIVAASNAWADGDPERMVKIVTRDATPAAAGTWAAEPRILYRWGTHYVRIEETPDTQNGIHGLIVSNQRDHWIVNLADFTGRHIVDTAEDYDVHVPIAGEVKSPLVGLEFGCELEFMKSRGIKPVEILIGDKSLLQYEVSADAILIRLLVDPHTKKPWAVGVNENGNVSYLRYESYEIGLDPDPKLFQRPAGIDYSEAN